MDSGSHKPINTNQLKLQATCMPLVFFILLLPFLLQPHLTNLPL